MNIYVGNLDFKVDENDLREVFEEYGSTSSVNIISDKFTGRSKGFGFVTMENDEEAKRAISELNGAMLASREMIVNVARPKKTEYNNY